MKVYVLSHHTRSPEKVVNAILEQGHEAHVFTDHTNHCKEPRGSKTKLNGIVKNHWSILRDKTDDPWKLMFHDDLDLHSQCLENIEYILKFAPRAPICFYVPTNKGMMTAMKQGHHVHKSQANSWYPATAYPTNEIMDFLSWAEDGYADIDTEGTRGTSEDTMLKMYNARKNKHTYTILPSFVQHAGAGDSTLGNPRNVGKYIRESFMYRKDLEFDARDIDWMHEFDNPYIDKTVERKKLPNEL